MTKLEGIIRFEKIRDKHMCSKDSSLMQEFRKLIGEIFDDFNYPEHKHQAEKQEQQSPEFESDVDLKELEAMVEKMKCCTNCAIASFDFDYEDCKECKNESLWKLKDNK